MRLTAARPLLLALIFCCAVPTHVGAAPPGGGGPGVTPPPQPGPITVHHRNGSGGVSATTSIPYGSTFRTQGGGDRAPCTFTYYADRDGDGSVDPDAVPEQRQSMQWTFRETTERTVDSEHWEEAAALSGTEVEEIIATYGPVDEAFRRFQVFCTGTQGSGLTTNQSLGSTLVSVRDPFWGVFAGVARVWAGVQLDRPSLSTIPSSDVFGGLPVNMPTSLQIGADHWVVYASPPVDFRGWSARLVLTPAALDFVVGFEPDDGSGVTLTVPCFGGFVEPDGSQNIPARDDSIPDFAEPGQLDEPCVWIPPEPGDATIRARIIYRVRYVVSGFVEEQPPYEWESDPLTVRVDELRAVNTRPGS